MAQVAAIASLFLSAAGLAASSSAAKKSQGLAEEQFGLSEEQWEFTQKAQEAQYESDIATYGFNIEMAGMDIEALGKQKEYTLGVFGRESEKLSRAQREAYGASGAVVGVGTPLAVMEEQARYQEEMAGMIGETYEAGISKKELEKEFYGEQKERTESLLDELFPEEPEEPAVEEPKPKEEPPKYIGGHSEEELGEGVEGQTKSVGAGANKKDYVYRNGKWVLLRGGH